MERCTLHTHTDVLNFEAQIVTRNPLHHHLEILFSSFFSHYFKIFLWSLPISYFYCRFSTHIIFILFIKNPLESHHHLLILFLIFVSFVRAPLSLRFSGLLFGTLLLHIHSYPFCKKSYLICVLIITVILIDAR